MKRIPAYIMTALVVLTVVKCAKDRHHESKQEPDTTHLRRTPMPYMMKIGGCRYIVTPDGYGYIVNTIHAGDCPNEIHWRKRP